MKIVCVGGGPAGLFFALLMKRANEAHDITVVERNPAGITQGWGVVFWDDLLESMRESDPETTREIAAAAYQWHGVEVNVQGRAAVAPDATGYSIARQKLISLLSARAQARGIQVLFGQELDSSERQSDVDLVVAGDGVGSRFRTENADELGTELALGDNKFVWLGATKVFESFTFAFVESPAGWLWCHAYGYDQDRSTFIVECSPDTWRGLGFDQLDLGASLALLQQLFAAQLDGHQLMAQPRAGDTMPWQNFATVRNRRWHLDNVALMGDAAHTTHFSIGSGTKLALEDAMELAGALTRHGDVPTALSEYESHRRQALRPAQQNARYSARWFENVPRYTQLDVEQFADLMDRRRSTALAHLPPSMYLRLRRLADDNRVLRRQWERLRSRARPVG